MPELDLRPAAATMARILAGVPDGALTAATPCPDYTVAALIAHVDGFAQAFTAAARKDLGPMTATPPGPTGDLPEGWREDAATHLDALGEAWLAPDAWEGMTQAGGVDLPAPVAARVALDELVVHAWDLARATDQPYGADEADLAAVEATVQQFRGGNDGAVPGLFGPVVPVPADAPTLDRLLGLTGRDPGWQATRG
jgi:uncharacterized protein (TIGR03086 family)